MNTNGATMTSYYCPLCHTDYRSDQAVYNRPTVCPGCKKKVLALPRTHHYRMAPKPSVTCASCCREKDDGTAGMQFHRCEVCKAHYCGACMKRMPGTSRAISSHHMEVESDRLVCPQGHHQEAPLVTGEPLLNVGLDICTYCNRVACTDDAYTRPPVCKADNNTEIDRRRWFQFCVGDTIGGNSSECPIFQKAERPWWKIW